MESPGKSGAGLGGIECEKTRLQWLWRSMPWRDWDVVVGVLGWNEWT